MKFVCVMQVVRLANTHVTSPAASRASLVRWLWMVSDWLPRKTLDWIMAATCVYLFKVCLRVVWLTGEYSSSPLVIWDTTTSHATSRAISLVLLAYPFLWFSIGMASQSALCIIGLDVASVTESFLRVISLSLMRRLTYVPVCVLYTSCI